MQKLNEDLDNTAKQQKHDLALLEENRIKENEQLEETEKKLQAMAKQSIKLPERCVHLHLLLTSRSNK
jgi:hypothetical protein